MPYVDRSNNAERPIAIVDRPNTGSRRWQWITVDEAKQLVADLQAAIAEYDAKPSRPPRPQPKHDSGVWERRRTDRKWWRRIYEGGRS